MMAAGGFTKLYLWRIQALHVACTLRAVLLMPSLVHQAQFTKGTSDETDV
jgi:hypothetical protein